MLALAWVLLRRLARRAAPPATAAQRQPRRRRAAQRTPAGHGHGAAPRTFRRRTRAIPIGAAPHRDAGVVAPSHAPPLAEEPLLAGQEPAVPPDYDARDYAPGDHARAGERHCRGAPQWRRCLRAMKCSRRAPSFPNCGSTCTCTTPNPADAIRVHQHAQAARGRITARKACASMQITQTGARAFLPRQARSRWTPTA